MESGLCAAEGLKCIEDCIRLGWKPEWIGVDSAQAEAIEGVFGGICPLFLLPETGLSFLENPMGVVAVFPIPKPQAWPNSGPIVVLDGLQDPGNVGTLLRTCHWFGVADVFLLKGTADPFGPKAIQSSMGSIAAVRIHRTELDELKEWKEGVGLEFWVAKLDGESMVDLPRIKSSNHGWIVGNEGNGVRPEVANLGRAISIPSFSAKPPESLNAATALALFLGHHYLVKA